MGITESTSKSVSEDASDNKKQRDPLVSSLSRRNKRKAGQQDEYMDVDQIYKRMKDTPDSLPSHLQICLEHHQSKPWLEKSVKYTLIAYPSVGMNPPDDLKAFFSNIPHKSSSSTENKEVEKNGQNYIWYMPSKFLWKAHCYVQHQKDSQISCSSKRLVRTFTDSYGNTQAFVFGVVFKDDTFRILTDKDYKAECEWWNRQTTVSGGFGERKMLLKTKSIDTREGEVARRLMKDKIAHIFTKIGKISSPNDTFIQTIEEQFISNIRKQQQTTIYDYAENCLRIFIFANPDSPLAKYTLIFRTRMIRGYFNAEIIPELTTEEMFPEYYAQSSKGSVENVRNWIISYLRQEIEDFFDMLVTYLDPTLSKPTKVRDAIGDVPVDVDHIKDIKEYCPDIDSAPEDIIIYKDSDDIIYCFNIDELLNRTSDVNWLDQYKKNIDSIFLHRFDKEFRGKERRKEIIEDEKKKEKTSKKDHKCAQCAQSIEDYVLRTGSVEKDGDSLKAHVKEFCSSDCLDEYKQMEELFGKSPNVDQIKDEVSKTERSKFDQEKRDLLDQHRREMEEFQFKYNTLQDNVTQLENSLRLAEAGIERLSGEKSNLTSTIDDKQRSLEEKEAELRRLSDEIASRAGIKKPSGMSLDDILSSMDQKIVEKDKRLSEKDDLEKEIIARRDEINQLKEDLKQKAISSASLSKTIEYYKNQLLTKDQILNDAKVQGMKLIAEREKTYKDLHDQINSLGKERNDLLKQIDKLSKSDKEKDQDFLKKLKIKEDEIRMKLEETISQCKITTESIEEDKETAQQRIKMLEESLFAEQKLKKQLEEDSNSKHKLVKELETQITELNNKILGMDELNKKIAERKPLVDTSATAKREFEELQLQLNKLKSISDDKKLLEDQLNSVKQELYELKEKESMCATDDTIIKNKKKISDMNSKIVSQETIINKFTKEIKKYKDLSSSCKKDSDIEKQLDDLKRDHKKELEEKELAFQQQQDEAKKEFEDKLKKVPSIKPSDDETKEKLEAEIKAKYEKMLKEQMNELREKFNKESSESKAKIDELNSLIQEGKDQSNELSDQIKSLDKKKDEDLEKILQQQREELNKLIEETKKERDEEKEKRKEMVQKLEQDLKEAKDACEKSCDEKCKIKEKVKEVEIEIEDSENEEDKGIVKKEVKKIEDKEKERKIREKEEASEAKTIKKLKKKRDEEESKKLKKLIEEADDLLKIANEKLQRKK